MKLHYLRKIQLMLLASLCVFLGAGALEETREEGEIAKAAGILPEVVHLNIEEDRLQGSQEKGEPLTQKATLYEETYLTTHQGIYHNVLAYTYNGDRVVFEDGSEWDVDPPDRYKVFKWLTTDSVFVTQNPTWFSTYTYQLINRQTGDHVAVDLSVGPVPNGYYTYWVTYVDSFNHRIHLSDGSVWEVKWVDGLANFWVNDTVVIGVNVHAGSYVNILINAGFNNKYVRATRVY